MKHAHIQTCMFSLHLKIKFILWFCVIILPKFSQLLINTYTNNAKYWVFVLFVRFRNLGTMIMFFEVLITYVFCNIYIYILIIKNKIAILIKNALCSQSLAGLQRPSIDCKFHYAPHKVMAFHMSSSLKDWF